MTVAPTWPANAARQKRPGPTNTSAASTAAAVPASWTTGSPATIRPLLNSRHPPPETTPAGLDATS